MRKLQGCGGAGAVVVVSSQPLFSSSSVHRRKRSSPPQQYGVDRLQMITVSNLLPPQQPPHLLLSGGKDDLGALAMKYESEARIIDAMFFQIGSDGWKKQRIMKMKREKGSEDGRISYEEITNRSFKLMNEWSSELIND